MEWPGSHVSQPINVFILTYCRNEELFYGTELIFKTLRVGFPNAKVTVVDNASFPTVRGQIELLAKKNDCAFRPIPGRGVWHHDFLESTLRDVATGGTDQGALVFLDPDICLWESCEDFGFDGLIAGVLVSKHQTKADITMPRLHTSFLWIPHAASLWDEVRKIRIRHFDFNPFASVSFRMDDTWYRFDTGASLFAAIPDRISYFDEQHLKRYDHLVSGSHLNCLLPVLHEEFSQLLIQIHAWARDGNLEALRGIRRRQLDVWRRSASGMGEHLAL